MRATISTASSRWRISRSPSRACSSSTATLGSRSPTNWVRSSGHGSARPRRVFSDGAGGRRAGSRLCSSYWLSREARSTSPFRSPSSLCWACQNSGFPRSTIISTILGMPLLALAIVHALHAIRIRLRPCRRRALTGTAVLLRMDFILVCPLLATWRAWPREEAFPEADADRRRCRCRSRRRLCHGHSQRAGHHRDTAPERCRASRQCRPAGLGSAHELKRRFGRVKLVGWLLFLVGSPVVVLDAALKRGVAHEARLAAAVVSAYPMANILSPKYILPEAPFLLLLFVHVLDILSPWISSRFEKLAFTGLVLVALLPALISVSFARRPLIPDARPASSKTGRHAGRACSRPMVATSGR